MQIYFWIYLFLTESARSTLFRSHQLSSAMAFGPGNYLSIYLIIHLYIYSSIYILTHLSINPSTYPSIYWFYLDYISYYWNSFFMLLKTFFWELLLLWTYPSNYESIYLPTYLSIYLSMYLYIYLSIYLSIYVCSDLQPTGLQCQWPGPIPILWPKLRYDF